MGQFYSREFDGDPYIDLMRSLPERELVWWAQKVIWLAEGFTFVDHFRRTYPRILVHKCAKCKGAGVLTCPVCHGTGKRGMQPALAAASGSVASLADGLDGCRACGTACEWDAESEWADKWQEWESKLAYYDKATGPLMDEWYEDVINAGNLEEDTAPVEEEPPGPEDQSRWAQDDRMLAKERKRFAGVFKRFGHPYDADASLGYQIVDPTATMGENIWNMAQVYNSYPPELNPLRTNHVVDAARAADEAVGIGGDGGVLGSAAALAARADAAVMAFDAQAVMEAAIMQNLEAAAQDRPKPNRFTATSGTVLCDRCEGSAWWYSPFPNPNILFGTERPYWADTLARLNKYWNPTPGSDPSLPYGPDGIRALLAAPVDGEEAARLAIEEVVGPAPASTERYRRDLEALIAAPQLRDSRIQVPAGRPGSLQQYITHVDETEGSSKGRTGDAERWAGSLLPAR